MRKLLLTCCLIGLIGGVGAYYLAREQNRIRSLYGDQPQTISVAELAAKGYGDNVWVDLTDAEPGSTYVIEYRKGSMSAVWVPVFPKGMAKQAKTIQVILRSTASRSDADIAERFKGRSSFRGAVINPTLLWPHEPYRPLLQEKYPTLALTPSVWEVDVDYDKPSPQLASGFYTAAIALLVVGVVCGIAWLLGVGQGKVADPSEGG
jgi:hypothetical protein